MNTLSQINENLFICDFSTSLDINILQRHGISKIIFISEHSKDQEKERQYERKNIKHHHLKLYDSPNEKITKMINFLPDASEMYKSSKVLVHCMAGISRSPTFAILLLMYSDGLRYVEAYEIVRRGRPVMRPNDGFAKQLRQFEDLLNCSRNRKY